MGESTIIQASTLMQSVAKGQFPQVVWRKNKKYLWNPVRRQALKNRPEERVRLRIVEYLLHGGWSKHRISTEQALVMPQREAKLRTDMLCYTKHFDPFLLVECKAENITLSAQTAEQIARYNQQIQAPFLLLTNGRTDYWYKINKQESVQLIKTIPEKLPQKCRPPSTFVYWQKRGMVGAKAAPNVRRWTQNALKTTLKTPSPRNLHYISFNQSPVNFDLANYYAIHAIEESRLAMAFTATPYGGSRLIVILNEEQKNRAVLEINLDLLFENQAPNASVYCAEGPYNIDVHRHLPNFMDDSFWPQKKSLPLLQLIRRTLHQNE